MPDAEKIHFYLNIFKGLQPEDLYSLVNASTSRVLAPGDVFIREGDTGKRIAYIQQGLIRCYHVNEKGSDVTLFLRWEDQFIASHDCIILQQPSRFTYQAMEQTTLLEASYTEIEQLLDKNPAFEKARYHFILHMLSESMARVESFVLLNPEERYLQLIREKPDLMQRVHDKHIATLLGITPVSLSRIRKRIALKHTR